MLDANCYYSDSYLRSLYGRYAHSFGFPHRCKLLSNFCPCYLSADFGRSGMQARVVGESFHPVRGD